MEEGEKDRLEDVDYDLARRQLDTVQESGRNGHCGGSRGRGSDATTKVADTRDLQLLPGLVDSLTVGDGKKGGHNR